MTCEELIEYLMRYLDGELPPAEAARFEKHLYACPACDARFLGEQRCPDCNTFARRLGPGGPCPHCDEPVAVSDLLQTGNGGAAPAV